MKNKSTIFLTGATGLLGSYLLKLFLEKDHKVYALARSKNNKSATERVYDYVRFWDESLLPPFLNEDTRCISEGDAKEKNLIVVEGDITHPNLGIQDPQLLKKLTSEVEVIYHSAALARLRAPLDVIRKINVEGTKNVLDFALKCQMKGKLKKMNHISTAYVAGTIGEKDFTEDMFELGQEFNNVYEQTKYESEKCVRDFQKKNTISITIFRPSLVMGDSQEGRTTDFHLFYEPLHFLNEELYNEFPIDRNLNENMINIDTVGKAIYLLGDDTDESVYHITSPEQTNVEFFMNLAANYFKFRMPRIITLSKFSFDTWTPVQKLLAEPFIPYFNYKTRFISERTQKALKQKAFSYPQIDERNFLRIFSYCKKRKFIS